MQYLDVATNTRLLHTRIYVGYDSRVTVPSALLFQQQGWLVGIAEYHES